jgi:hypothetical protein
MRRQAEPHEDHGWLGARPLLGSGKNRFHYIKPQLRAGRLMMVTRLKNDAVSARRQFAKSTSIRRSLWLIRP